MLLNRKNSFTTVREIRTKVTTYLGVGAIDKIDDIFGVLRSRGVSAALCVTGGHSYRLTGAWDKVTAAAERHGIELALYNRVTPNPTTDAVDEAAACGRAIGAGAVVTIGGGSPIDCGKGAAVLLANPDFTGEDVFCGRAVPDRAAPIVAINLTHGTGSEVNRFAVATVTRLQFKPAIALDCIYPAYSIDDPALMTGLSPHQTLYVSIDAVNHCIEAATTTCTNPYAVMLAEEAISTVYRNLPRAMAHPDELGTRGELAYAAMLAGVAFDNGMLHLTHALEHPLSGVKPSLSHGLGLAMILPAVVNEIYPACAQTMAYILRAIVPGLAGMTDEARKVALAVQQWIFGLGVTEKLEDMGFTEDDVPALCDLVEQTPSLSGLVSLAPVTADRDMVGRIYTNSLRPMA